MGVQAESHCGEAHGVVVTDIAILKETTRGLKERLDRHQHNGPYGHVSRTEFNDLSACVKDLRKAAYWAVFGVLVFSAGGSAFGPVLKTLLAALLH